MCVCVFFVYGICEFSLSVFYEGGFGVTESPCVSSLQSSVGAPTVGLHTSLTFGRGVRTAALFLSLSLFLSRSLVLCVCVCE